MTREYIPPSRAKALDVDKLNSIPSVFMVAADWSKQKIAFYGNETGRLELYVMDLQTRNIEQISDGQIPKSPTAGYAWGRDNRTIYFAKDTDGNEVHNIYSVDIVTKEFKQYTFDLATGNIVATRQVPKPSGEPATRPAAEAANWVLWALAAVAVVVVILCVFWFSTKPPTPASPPPPK